MEWRYWSAVVGGLVEVSHSSSQWDFKELGKELCILLLELQKQSPLRKCFYRVCQTIGWAICIAVL